MKSKEKFKPNNGKTYKRTNYWIGMARLVNFIIRPKKQKDMKKNPDKKIMKLVKKLNFQMIKIKNK